MSVQASLTCPYTRKSITVEHIQGRGWMALGAFSIGTPMAVPRDVYEIVLRRRGRESLRNDLPLTCPYLGTPLVVKETTRGWVATGGFDAARVLESYDELLIAFSKRDGEDDPAAKEAVVASMVERKGTKPVSRAQKEPGAPALEIADRVLHGLAKKV